MICPDPDFDPSTLPDYEDVCLSLPEVIHTAGVQDRLPSSIVSESRSVDDTTLQTCQVNKKSASNPEFESNETALDPDSGDHEILDYSPSEMYVSTAGVQHRFQSSVASVSQEMDYMRTHTEDINSTAGCANSTSGLSTTSCDDNQPVNFLSLITSLQTQIVEFFDISKYEGLLQYFRSKRPLSEEQHGAYTGDTFNVQHPSHIHINPINPTNSTLIPAAAAAASSRQACIPSDDFLGRDEYYVQYTWTTLLDETRECRLNSCISLGSCLYCIHRKTTGPVHLVSKQLVGGPKGAALEDTLGTRLNRLQEYSGATVKFRERRVEIKGTRGQIHLAEKGLTEISKQLSDPKVRYAILKLRGEQFRDGYEKLSNTLKGSRLLQKFDNLHFTICQLHTDISQKELYEIMKQRICPDVRQLISTVQAPITISFSRMKNAGLHGFPKPRDFFDELRAIFRKHDVLSVRRRSYREPHMTLIGTHGGNLVRHLDRAVLRNLDLSLRSISFGDLEPDSILISHTPNPCFSRSYHERFRREKRGKDGKHVKECIFMF